MKRSGPTAAWLLALVVIAGCAGSEVGERQTYAGDEQIARPGRIIVYNFAATPDDVWPDAVIAGHYDRRDTPQTAEEIELGRKLGKQVALDLVKEILKMGFSAELAGFGVPPQLDDIVIKGGFISIDEGSVTKRMLIGFGAGAAKLETFVEGYQVTADGLRPLGSAEIEAGGGKLPGMLVPVAGGAAAGTAATSVAISGGLNIVQERGPESIEGAAERTAEEIAKVLEEAFRKQGWL
jgi:hypothetical protein